jgi:anthranilate synthase/aminodeoxychorismate synthase-like glutamine amidotransferase
MLVLIDNYDSFTYNLYQILGELGAEITVVRNDAVTVREVESLRPDRIVISPGPCTPNEAGISTDIVRFFGYRIPVLGVCLGHQCIGVAYGAKIRGAGEIVHGKSSSVSHDGQGIFTGLPDPLEAIRYHSLVIDEKTIPPELLITARTDHGLVMGIRHRIHQVEGIQFHPESILTPDGKQLMQNFLDIPV